MDVNRIIRTQVTTGELTPPAELVSGVNDGQVALIEVVKGLGEYLTSTEDDTRLKGLSFLTNLLKAIQPSKINRQTTQTLTRFYLSKLDDFDSLSPALNALIVLSKQPTFDDDAAREVYRGLCDNVNMKAHVQAIRHLVYQVFDSLLALHRSTMKAMGSDFINSFTKMVDGEKDPRNLMLLFSLEKVILLEFDVQEHIEDLFDVTFCYFPISFRPPPNDPYGITADDLKVSLRACMAASPYFAKLALPLFLEKFTTAAGPSMADLMLSMAQCFPTYGAAAVRERGTELWEGIKTEILYSSDGAVEAAALKACESLARTMYPAADDAPVGLGQDMIKESLEALAEPEKAQSLGATKILVALIRSAPSVGTFAISQALPQLFRQFNRPTMPSHRAPILAALSAILIACQTVYAPASATRHQAHERSLEPFKENLLDTLREGLRTEGLKISAIRGSVALVDIPEFLLRSEVEDLLRGMNDVLINEEDLETKQVVIKGLSAICGAYSSLVESATLPLLFHNLPDRAPTLSENVVREKYRSILASLSELCIQPSLFETLVIRINNKLDLLASTPITAAGSNGASPDEARECTIAYIWDLVNTLTTVIDSKLAAKHVDVVKYFDQIIPRLYGLAVAAAAPRIGDVVPVFQDRRLLTAIARISETMTWELGIERQNKHFAAVYDGFEKGKMDAMVPAASSSSTPLRATATSPEKDLISLYSSVVQGIKTETASPYTSAADYLASKVYWTIRVAADQFQVRWALDLITAFVNKRVNELEGSLDSLLEQVWLSDVQDTSGDYETRRRGLMVYLHVVKGLSLVRHPLAYTASERVIEILALSNLDALFVDEAARGFGILAEGKGKGKERGSHLTTKLLYAQKMWNFVLPKLIEGDKDASGKGRLAYLVAFSSLLPLIPASLCLSDLDRLLPLLLRSLSLPHPAQRANTILALSSVLETVNHTASIDNLLHANALAIVEGVLRSAIRNKESPAETSGAVRAAALRCLAIVPDVLRFEVLQSEKSRVLRELGNALDDPLRTVRKEAVECRARWYRYGGSS